MVVTDILLENILFEVEDVFAKKVRTTKNYWQKIKTDKHRELKFEFKDVIKTLQFPDEVYLSVRDKYIRLFFRDFDEEILVVLVKYFNDHGFVVTVYQTTKVKRKGEKLWPK